MTANFRTKKVNPSSFTSLLLALLLPSLTCFFVTHYQGGYPLLLVSWVPLLLQLKQRRNHRASCLLLAWAAWLCLLSVQLAWVPSVLRQDPSTTRAGELIWTLLFILTSSSSGLVLIFFWTWFDWPRQRLMVLFPLLGVLLEKALEVFPFGGFPAYSLVALLPLDLLPQGLIAIAGVNCVSLMIYALQAFCAITAQTKTRRLILCCGIMGWIILNGIFQGQEKTEAASPLQDFESATKNNLLHSSVVPHARTIAVVPGIASVSQLYDPEQYPQLLSDLSQRSQQLLSEFRQRLPDKAVDLLVWPESAYPGLLEKGHTLVDLQREISNWGVDLLLGGNSLADYHYQAGRSERNSAFRISHQNFSYQRYDKMRLVPFAEFLPAYLGQWGAKKALPMISEFEAGNSVELWQDAIGSYAVLICFEALFSQDLLKRVQSGADMLIVLTNTSWFPPQTQAYFNHLTLLQAMALGRSILIVGNSTAPPKSNAAMSKNLLPEISGTAAQTPSSLAYDAWSDQILEINRPQVIQLSSLKQSSIYTQYGIFTFWGSVLGVLLSLNFLQIFSRLNDQVQ